MSYRSEDRRAEELIASMGRRLARIETAQAALPGQLYRSAPLFVADGQHTGDLLVWRASVQQWMVLPRGTTGQHLVVAPSAPSGLLWVT